MADDTAELNALLEGATGTVTLDAERYYSCDESVQLLDLSIDLDMNGATILRSIRQRGSKRMSVHARNCSGSIRNGHIIGFKNPQSGYQHLVEGEHGIGLYACRDFLVEDVTIEHVSGDFIEATGVGGGGKKAKPSIPSRNITLNRVTCLDAGRHAIAALNVDGLVIDHSTFRGWRRARIDRENMTGDAVHRGIDDRPTNTWIKRAG